MSNVLIVADCFPQPDQASGDLRFFTLLSLLAHKHNVLFCALKSDGTIQPRNADSERLEQAGITLGEVDLPHVLKGFSPDIVWFEFHYLARSDYIRLIARYAPKARTVVDSVDVHYNRFEARAKLTGSAEDIALAHEIKKTELAAYARVDMVIAVSEEDNKLLQIELPDKPIVVIPNIHTVPTFPDPANRRHGELVFIGGFKHHPNVDAMLYFCREIMPLVKKSNPTAHLKIIGSNPLPEILALASEDVDVVGYVPDVAPYLETAYISVAPLRYGGGMKGKVGEAMSYGLPVVTTSYGAEGFGLLVGRDLLVGDTAETFAAEIDRLLNDSALHARVAQSGYRFIENHYSMEAVEARLVTVIDQLICLPQRISTRLLGLVAPITNLYVRHVAWRLGPK